MDKGTLSNYGWIVIVALVMSVMLALATPFGKFVGQGVSAIANGFVNSSEIDEDHIKEQGDEWMEYLQNPSGNNTSNDTQGYAIFAGYDEEMVGGIDRSDSVSDSVCARFGAVPACGGTAPIGG